MFQGKKFTERFQVVSKSAQETVSPFTASLLDNGSFSPHQNETEISCWEQKRLTECGLQNGEEEDGRQACRQGGRQGGGVEGGP
jgi:hypothetical protein